MASLIRQDFASRPIGSSRCSNSRPSSTRITSECPAASFDRSQSIQSQKPDPVLARHAANLSLISSPSGLRPDLDVAEGVPIAAALACMLAPTAQCESDPARLEFILPSGVGTSD